MPFVEDSFTGSDGDDLGPGGHVGETGAAWTYSATHSDPGGLPLEISNANRARAQAGASAGDESVCYASGLPAGAEYDVEIVLRYLTANAETGLVARLDPAANTLYRARYRQASGSWQLHKRVAGANTLLGSYAQALALDTDYLLLLEVRNGSKRVLIDGVERIATSDNDVTAGGRVGLAIASAGGNGIRGHVDRLRATDFASAAREVAARARSLATVTPARDLDALARSRGLDVRAVGR